MDIFLWCKILSDVLLIVDLDQPTFDTKLPNTVSVIEGRSLSVMCSAAGNPNAEYRWINSSGATVSVTHTLLFQNISRSDAKTYTCIANNGLEKNSSLSVDVQCEFSISSLYLVKVNLANCK